MSTPIDYQSKVKPPGEYEHAYDQERGRWLRRRLLWYSGTSLAFGLLMSLLGTLFTNEENLGVGWMTLILSNAASALVMIIAWRTKPDARAILKIAFLFYVIFAMASATSFRDRLGDGLTFLGRTSMRA